MQADCLVIVALILWPVATLGHVAQILPSDSITITYSSSKDDWQRTVDGDTSGKWKSNSCARSEGKVDEWVRYSFAERFTQSATIYGRTDCCHDRSQNLSVVAGTCSGSIVLIENLDAAVVGGVVVPVGSTVSYIEVSRPGTNGRPLFLCEVQIHTDENMTANVTTCTTTTATMAATTTAMTATMIATTTAPMPTPTPAPPMQAPTAPTPYTKVTSGKCQDINMYPVTSTTGCNAAAIALDLSNTTVSITSWIPEPEGCYWLNGNLWLSNNAANTGNGVIDSQELICMAQAPMAPTPLPTDAPAAAATPQPFPAPTQEVCATDDDCPSLRPMCNGGVCEDKPEVDQAMSRNTGLESLAVAFVIVSIFSS